MRIEWIDRWKGLLILLVIIGHTVGSVSHVCNGYARDVFEFIYKAIYMFHMPAFFCVVGICWKYGGGRIP